MSALEEIVDAIDDIKALREIQEMQAETIRQLQKRIGDLTAPKEFLTRREVCEQLGISYSSARKAEYRHLLPDPDTVIFGKARWHRSTVEKFVEDRLERRRAAR